MSGIPDRQPRTASGDDGDALDRLMEQRPEPSLEVAAALRRLEASRIETSEALDELSSATRSALDIPSKVRRNPVRTAALIGGVGFLIARGPQRAARFVGGKVRPARRRPDAHEGLLPPEIEKVLKDAGLAKDPAVRRALARDFADYLKQKGRYEPEPNAATTFWRTFDRVAGPLGTVGARLLVKRLMEADETRSAVRREARERRRAQWPGLRSEKGGARVAR